MQIHSCSDIKGDESTQDGHLAVSNSREFEAGLYPTPVYLQDRQRVGIFVLKSPSMLGCEINKNMAANMPLQITK